MIKIFIGPNGYGKTTQLETEKKLLLQNNINEDDILFLPSEILLLDEMKDTKDSTQTMEYLLTEILVNEKINEKKNELENLIDDEINNSKLKFNSVIETVLSYNEKEREKDFIAITHKKEYKKLVKIETKDIKEKMGSGQRLHVLLGLIKNSARNHIFIDEPEKYSHPSLLNKTADLINELIDADKKIFIATHSSKLVSMLQIDLKDIYILNDEKYQVKQINNAIIESETKDLIEVPYPKEILNFYNMEKLEVLIKQYYYREFIEALFTKKIILCEGVNDVVFIKKILVEKNLYHNDNVIFRTGGKHLIPLFISIFKQLDIELYVYYDKDDEYNQQHSASNEFIRNCDGIEKYEFSPNLEKEIGCGNIQKDRSLELINFLIDYKVDDSYNILN